MPFLVKYVMNKKIDSELRLNAAMDFLTNQPPNKTVGRHSCYLNILVKKSIIISWIHKIKGEGDRIVLRVIISLFSKFHSY
jgi:hypothetical protein